MNGWDAGGQLAVMYEPHLLPSESQGRYKAMRDAMLAEFKPRNAIEEMWICEIIHGEWEMQRLHGFKAMMIASARRPALKNLLSIALDASGAANVDELAERFFTNKAVRKKVIDILSKYGMTEASIDTEAFRHCLVEIGEINRRLAELSSRRDKNRQQLEDYRAGLATPTQSRHGGDAMLGGDNGD
jgi:DNA-binding MarR family transcriptional regulator